MERAEARGLVERAPAVLATEDRLRSRQALQARLQRLRVRRFK